VSTAPNPLNPSLFGNPANPVGTNSPNPFTAPPPITSANGNPGDLENPGSNLKDAMRNAGLLNVQEGQIRNQMIPQFANLMQQYATPSANFFANLMNLGSPYYKQKQEEGFNQGVQQNQNAAAQARQQLQSSGYGNTPSGANAAMIGGMNMQGSQNLAQAYLQNLFQNENLQAQGAGGLAQMAALFNPAQLFGENTVSGSTQGPTASSQFKDVMSGINSLFSGGGNSAASGASGGAI
jgi:hypothetical protein